jgi:quercetin dioxygenase-like cupin family protein
MQKVTVDDLEAVPHFMGANTTRRPLSRAIEGMGFAMTYFELEAGEAFSGGLHTHHDQEELFYVLEGTATFEIREQPDGPSESLTVSAGEAIHFGREDVYQTGGNESERPVVGLAIGVPGSRHGWEGVEAVLDCGNCGRETAHSIVPADKQTRMPDAEEMVLTCRECGTEA